MEKRGFGVDIGGTTVKMGLFTTDGKVLRKWEIVTRKEDKGRWILSDIAASIQNVIKEEKLEKDSYYIADILGCRVNTDINQELGKVVDVFQTGSNDVYVVKDEQGKQILLPAIKQVIKNVDIKNKIITVHLLEGLV